MLHEVRIFDANYHLKKVVSTNELSRRHWMGFEKSEAQNVLPQVKKKKFQNN